MNLSDIQPLSAEQSELVGLFAEGDPAILLFIARDLSIDEFWGCGNVEIFLLRAM